LQSRTVQDSLKTRSRQGFSGFLLSK
jgi:hypothetical protein